MSGNTHRLLDTVELGLLASLVGEGISWVHAPHLLVRPDASLLALEFAVDLGSQFLCVGSRRQVSAYDGLDCYTFDVCLRASEHPFRFEQLALLQNVSTIALEEVFTVSAVEVYSGVVEGERDRVEFDACISLVSGARRISLSHAPSTYEGAALRLGEFRDEGGWTRRWRVPD